MVGVSYDQKPYRRAMMETWGATVHRSPSELTDAGRAQAEHSTGSLGIAISEAVEVAARADDTNYSLGSVLNHVCLHQTVIGQETLAQLEMAGEYPEVVVGCVGGGSNFAGIAYPLIRRRLREGLETRFVAAEPAACPTLTRGAYRYDFGDTVGLTPLMPMYTLGPRLRAAARARRRPALPRRRAEPLRAGQGGRRRGAGDRPDRGLRRRGALCPGGGDPPRARAGARATGRLRRGAGGEGGRARSG